jgi:hypothetical protein
LKNISSPPFKQSTLTTVDATGTGRPEERNACRVWVELCISAALLLATV